MRIGIAQLSQETNTFNPRPTTRRDFEEFGLVRGPAIIDTLARTNELGGFISSLNRWPERPEIVGLVRLMAWPGGLATRDTFDWVCDELTSSLREAGPLDGLLISLHGALVAQDHPDVEGDVLAAIREVIGAETPLVATLDLHANLTWKMASQADVLVTFHTAPHVDIVETGMRAAALLRRMLVEGIRPAMALAKIPMVPPVEAANTQDRASVSYALRERLQALESRPEILSAGLTTVQPWLDVPDLGSAVLVTTAGDAALAAEECRLLAQEVWNRRRDYMPRLVSLSDAVREARGIDGLVVLSDPADATTSGAPGDSTWLLRELLKYDWPRGAVLTMVAPEVVEQAAACVGGTIATTIGGRLDRRFSSPLEITSTVERAFPARFVLSGHLGENLAIDMGPSVVLRVGDTRIVVTSRSGPHFAPALFQAAGIDPFALHVLVAKSPCGFRAAYTGRAARIISVMAPGCAPPDFWNYEYHNIPRPLWPWDETHAWHAETRVKTGHGS